MRLKESISVGCELFAARALGGGHDYNAAARWCWANWAAAAVISAATAPN